MCQTQSNVSAVGMSDLKLLRTGSRERTGSMTFHKMSDIESLVVAKTSTTIVISNGETDTNESSRVIKPSSHRQGPLCKKKFKQNKGYQSCRLEFYLKVNNDFSQKERKY